MDVREVETTRQPLKVVLDSGLRTPPTAKILAGGNTLVVGAADDLDRVVRLEDAGAEVLLLADGAGRVNLQLLMQDLARREINEVMVEAGCTLNGALLQAGLVDELVMYTAPVLLGDRARGLFALPELTQMDQRRELRLQDVTMVGRDVRLRARVN
jgi:diaminohydroxyphosphoribosylaminopyrimidine deaminase/5-amino-6-(5-phosphoribosylamino)uracil reductase